MTSYTREVKQCPHCNNEFNVTSVASHNTIGAIFYTDGFVKGPMYDQGSALLICPCCHEYIWKEDVVAVDSASQEKSLLMGFDVLGKLYEEALNSGIWKRPDQEKYLRIRVWWFFNDAFRNKACKNLTLTKDQEVNLQRLLNLLDLEREGDLVMKAEIYRELGRFDECIKLLKRPFDTRYQPGVDVINELAIEKVRIVGIVFEPESESESIARQKAEILETISSDELREEIVRLAKNNKTWLECDKAFTEKVEALPRRDFTAMLRLMPILSREAKMISRKGKRRTCK